jgi:hypothetical protein
MTSLSSLSFVLTKAQRQSVYRLWLRDEKKQPYRQFRRRVQPAYGCVIINLWGMWLGIEPDGYTHS